MTYWPRVLRTFAGLTIPGVLLPLLFYWGLYAQTPDATTLLSIPGILLLLALAIPAVSDNYAIKKIPLESASTGWEAIIRDTCQNTHTFHQTEPGRILLKKRENPALQWFFMGRRNIYITQQQEIILFYGPGEVSKKLIEKIFR